MVALFVAVITLSNADPDAVKTQHVTIVKQDQGADGLGLDKSLSGLPLDAANVVSVCTFGAPPLGPQLWNDATALTRTFTQPQCAGDTTGFGAPFAVQTFGSAFVPFEEVTPWVYGQHREPVVLEVAPRRSASFGSNFSGVPRALDGFAFHPLPGFIGGGHALASEPRVPVETSRPVPVTRR